MFNEFRSSKSWEISPKVRKMPMKIAFAFFVLSQTLSFLIDLLPILGIYCMIIILELFSIPQICTQLYTHSRTYSKSLRPRETHWSRFISKTSLHMVILVACYVVLGGKNAERLIIKNVSPFHSPFQYTFFGYNAKLYNNSKSIYLYFQVCYVLFIFAHAQLQIHQHMYYWTGKRLADFLANSVKSDSFGNVGNTGSVSLH